MDYVAIQAPLSMEFSRPKYWSRSPFPPPGDLPDLGIETVSLMSPALAGRFFTTSAIKLLKPSLALESTVNSASVSLKKSVLLVEEELPRWCLW